VGSVDDDETAVTVEAGRRNDLSSAVTPERCGIARASSSSTPIGVARPQVGTPSSPSNETSAPTPDEASGRTDPYEEGL
jgi:hypothetical protein